MLTDSMIIKLIHAGADIGPDYSLEIYGKGKVIYDGVENVKVKGIVESSIDNDRVISLLSEFKESGFFSLNDAYSLENSISRPYTIVSISIPKENSEMMTKSIKYYHGDKRVPEKLKILANKIEEIVGSSKWVGDLSEYQGFGQKSKFKSSLEPISDTGQKAPSESIKKKPIKLMVVGVIFMLLICIIFYSIYSVVTNLPSENNTSSDDTEIIDIGKNLEITVLEPASDVRSYRDYDPQLVFYNGSRVWIYQEYANISTIDEEYCDLILGIQVKNGDYILQPENVNKSKIGNLSHAWWFDTDDSWLSGIYYVTVSITDTISNLTIDKLAVFTLI